MQVVIFGNYDPAKDGSGSGSGDGDGDGDGYGSLDDHRDGAKND